MATIAPTAQVADNVTLADDVVVEDFVRLGSSHGQLVVGAGVTIRSGSVVYGDTVIGDGVQIGHHAVIRENTRIGSDVMIGTHVVVDGNVAIGSRTKVQTAVYIPTGTTIEEDVFLGPNAILTNDKRMGAFVRGIRDRATEPFIGPIVRRGARIGANSTILPEIEIGQEAVVGSGTVVTRNAPAYSITVGNPGRTVGSVPDSELLYPREGELP